MATVTIDPLSGLFSARPVRWHHARASTRDTGPTPPTNGSASMARQRNATPSLNHYLDRLPRRGAVDGENIRFAGEGRTDNGRTSSGRTGNGRTDRPATCEDRATQLSLDNLGLVVSISRRYWFDGVDLDDLIQAGNVGLLRAAASFEPDHGLALATWLSFGIRQAMLDHLAGNQHVVALPRNVHQRLLQARPASGARPSRPLRLRPVPLDGPTAGDRPDSMVEHLPPQADEAPATAEQAAMTREISALLDTLDAGARRLVIERFGLDGCPPRGVVAQAAERGVSREAIRLRYNTAMAKLNDEARRRRLDHWLDCG